MVYTRALEDMGERSAGEHHATTAALGAGSRGDCFPDMLRPFAHQVGGHSRMLLFDSATVCKALSDRECHFYLNIPPEIKQFTPSFKGVFQVGMRQDKDFLSLRRNVSSTSSSTGSSRASANLGMDLDSDAVAKSTSNNKQSKSSGKECLSVNVIPEESLKVSRILDRGENSRSDKSHFLLLENVASKFNRPCIVDLKMGTRQHGDDAPEAKRRVHMAKCAASTSASLGVRMCGMQVYQANLGVYLCKDKYFGRRLDEDGFKQALHEFFHNGFQMRTQVIAKVVDKLRRLRKVVERQNSFRFYSSSLLIVYEGCSARESGHCGDSCCDMADEMDVDVEVDFGESSSSPPTAASTAAAAAAAAAAASAPWGQLAPTEDARHGCGDDDSCDAVSEEDDDKSNDSLAGSSSTGAGAVLSSMRRSSSSYRRLAAASSSSSSPDSSCEAAAGRRCHQTTTTTSMADDGLVDVRMIDFAHTTYEGVGDQITHRGPDNGYLLGLDNLCRFLTDMLSEASSDNEKE